MNSSLPTATSNIVEEILISQESTLSSTPKRRKKRGKYTEGISSKNHSDDFEPFEQFFAGITTTLRSFPLKDRLKAKAKIFEIVSNMKINILSRPSSAASHNSSDDDQNASMPEDPLIT